MLLRPLHRWRFPIPPSVHRVFPRRSLIPLPLPGSRPFPSRQEQIDTSSPEQEKQNNDDMKNTIEITNKNDQYCMRSAQITICSPFCPFNINTCICCKFFVGIDVDRPQSIKCSYSEPKNPKKI